MRQQVVECPALEHTVANGLRRIPGFEQRLLDLRHGLTVAAARVALDERLGDQPLVAVAARLDQAAVGPLDGLVEPLGEHHHLRDRSHRPPECQPPWQRRRELDQRIERRRRGRRRRSARGSSLAMNRIASTRSTSVAAARAPSLRVGHRLGTELQSPGGVRRDPEQLRVVGCLGEAVAGQPQRLERRTAGEVARRALAGDSGNLIEGAGTLRVTGERSVVGARLRTQRRQASARAGTCDHGRATVGTPSRQSGRG